MRFRLHMLLGAGLMALGLLVWQSTLQPAQAQSAVPADPQPDDAQPDPSVDVLTRGPVHEAFAAPTQAVHPAPVLIERQPPQAIDELPPEAKPQGDNVAWIAGYWQWDDERKDFLWVSGTWRVIPPGRQWVAGYWHQVDAGWQWTPGFWLSSEREEVSYLPAPPAAVEEAVTVAPSEEHFWVGGVWRWRDGQYRWRPGYWTRIQADWIWSPAHYVWTPSGYVFIDGYWDYPIATRGVIFAPVYFRTAIYARPRYFYSPSIVIDSGALSVNLFARPAYGHYYFGDYYDAHYVGLGFHPWFSVSIGTRAIDPMFAYYRHSNGVEWSVHLEERFDYLRVHPDNRPPRTYAAQTTIVKNTTIINNTTINNNTTNVTKNNFAQNNVMGTPVKQVAASNTSAMKFDKVPQAEREQIRKGADEQRVVAKQRAETESSQKATTGAPTTMKLQASASTPKFHGTSANLTGSGETGGSHLSGNDPNSGRSPDRKSTLQNEASTTSGGNPNGKNTFGNTPNNTAGGNPGGKTGFGDAPNTTASGKTGFGNAPGTSAGGTSHPTNEFDTRRPVDTGKATSTGAPTLAPTGGNTTGATTGKGPVELEPQKSTLGPGGTSTQPKTTGPMDTTGKTLDPKFGNPMPTGHGPTSGPSGRDSRDPRKDKDKDKGKQPM